MPMIKTQARPSCQASSALLVSDRQHDDKDDDEHMWHAWLIRFSELARIDEVALHIDDQKSDVLRLKHEVIRFCRNRWHGFFSSQRSCCVSGEVLAPAAKFGDVTRLGDGMRFAEKAFDLCAILDLDITDRERWGYPGQKTA